MAAYFKLSPLCGTHPAFGCNGGPFRMRESNQHKSEPLVAVCAHIQLDSLRVRDCSAYLIPSLDDSCYEQHAESSPKRSW